MKTINQKNNKKAGVVSLITVLVVGVFALGTTLTIAVDVLLEATKNTNVMLGDQAFYTAEAYNQEGAYQYILAQTYSGEAQTAGWNKTIDGEIEIDADPSEWPYVLVRGRSNNPTTHRSAAKKITIYPEGEAFNAAIYTASDLNLLGANGLKIIGNVYAKGNLNLNGNPVIDGDLYSAEEINVNGSNSNHEGVAFDNVTEVPAPEFNLNDYRTEAFCPPPSATCFDNIGQAKAVIEAPLPLGVVIYVDNGYDETPNGTLKLIGVNFNGSLVVVDDLDINNGTFVAKKDHAAIIVQGDLTVAGNTEITGVVYVKGKTTFTGGGSKITINGALISANEVSDTTIGGSVTINYDENLAKEWTNLKGISGNPSSNPPQVVGTTWIED